MAGGAPWRDLGVRAASAAVLIGATLAALYAGPVTWTVYVFFVYGLMLWELAPLCHPEMSRRRRASLASLPMIFPVLGLAAIAVGAYEFMLVDDGTLSKGFFGQGYASGFVALMVPVLAGMAFVPVWRLLWLSYGTLLAAAAQFFVYAYTEHGPTAIATLIALVAVSDTAGYFAGRALGGPKFWPRVSPSKTWSGTVAGWIGCAVIGLFILPAFGVGKAAAMAIAVGICFAAQMGDIAESAMKRRVGVKDASNLIPGHGGVLDRVDGLVAAGCLAALITFAAGA